MGVGDLRVGRKVKQMARAFYGRARAYDRAIDLPEKEERTEAIATALCRNVFGENTPSKQNLKFVVQYVELIISALDNSEKSELLNGQLMLPDARES